MSKLLTIAKDKYISIRGYHTDRHLVLIESDDWGSIRMPSRETFFKLKKEGDCPENDAFLSNDSIENEEDLLELFKVLNSVRDSKGSPAVMTANFVMANPNFDKIDYQNNIYIYEPFYKTYEKYYSNNRILDTIQIGRNTGCFIPQLHCREHLNVNRWMRDLRNGKKDTLTAFKNKMIGIGATFSEDNFFGYMDAFNTVCTSSKEIAIIIKEAVTLFEEVFKCKSDTFVASCFVWDKSLEDALLNEDIKGIQSGPWQYVPCGEDGKNKLKRSIHYTGERNKNGQIYTVRNCSFEPAYLQNPEETVKECLEDIHKAFRDRKPAIINSHRFNYISRINVDNARNNLLGLKKLLEEIKNQYKDVEFISTPKLLNIIEREKK